MREKITFFCQIFSLIVKNKEVCYDSEQRSANIWREAVFRFSTNQSAALILPILERISAG